MSDTGLSAEVLGKLLVALQTLDALPGVKGMAEFLQPSLREVPGIANAFMCLNGEFPSADQATIAKLDLHCPKAAGLSTSAPLCVLEDRPDIQLVAMRTPRQAFGCLQLVVDDEANFQAHRLPDFVHPDDAEEALQARARVIAGSSDKSVEKLRLVRADGATVWVRRVSVLLPGGDGQANLVMVQMEDITAEHEAQEALTYQAFHDPLTGLHNRAWILDILEVDLRAAKRLGHPVGALFVDLDNFKVVNDSLGHAAGDEVLATVADRIVAALRPGDRVGRFGGDEFVIVVQDVQDILEVERCAERVSASIAVDLQVRGHRIVPTASIGIATSTSSSTPES